MRRLIAVGLCAVMLAVGARAFAEDAGDVTYVGGTVPGMKEGAAGKLDMTALNALMFRAGAEELAAPYGELTRVEYREQNRFRLGVAATIVVGILKARDKVHTVTISWTNEKDPPNVVILEMPKDKARILLEVLRARVPELKAKAPEECTRGLSSGCTLQK
jgi:hypothetical protein